MPTENQCGTMENDRLSNRTEQDRLMDLLNLDSEKEIDGRAAYEANGFTLSQEPIIPAELVARAVTGMDAIRAGDYDTGRAPQPSSWKPGDDPNRLCKIEQPQFASSA